VPSGPHLVSRTCAEGRTKQNVTVPKLTPHADTMKGVGLQDADHGNGNPLYLYITPEVDD